MNVFVCIHTFSLNYVPSFSQISIHFANLGIALTSRMSDVFSDDDWGFSYFGFDYLLKNVDVFRIGKNFLWANDLLDE